MLCAYSIPNRGHRHTLEVHHYGKYILEDIVPKQEVEMGERRPTRTCNICTNKDA